MKKFFSYTRIRTVLTKKGQSLFCGLLLALLLVGVTACSDDKKSTSTTSTTQKPSTTTTAAAHEPTLSTDVVLDGLANPWDIGFLPDKTMLYTERSGDLNALKDGKVTRLARMPNVYVQGEGGLLGLAIDTDFEENRYIYTCFNSRIGGKRDVRVVRFTVDEKVTTASDALPIITGIEAKDSGRHSGCRVKSAGDGTLFVGTGDAARGTAPQSPTSLNGKILHVDREGHGVGGNLAAPFDSRIFTYGHRNVQGMVLFDKAIKGAYGFSMEHGSDRDDEINLIQSGNFGWSPTGNYDESVSMTDTKRFPDAIGAIWSSGFPTLAISGGDLLEGTQWGTYNGALAVAVLKDKQVKIIMFDENFAIVFEKTVLDTFGRVRTAVQGPDGNLYIATDDSSDGKIIKVTPQ